MNINDVQGIKYRVFLQSDLTKPYHESYTDFRIAVGSDRLPMPKVFNLQFEKLKVGQIVSQSGQIEFEYCCVENRSIIEENNELVVIIQGNLC